MRIIFSNFSVGQQGRAQALYSTMWGLGVASGSVLAGHFWQILGGETIFVIAGLSTMIGFIFLTGLPKKIEQNI